MTSTPFRAPFVLAANAGGAMGGTEGGAKMGATAGPPVVVSSMPSGALWAAGADTEGVASLRTVLVATGTALPSKDGAVPVQLPKATMRGSWAGLSRSTDSLPKNDAMPPPGELRRRTSQGGERRISFAPL